MTCDSVVLSYSGSSLYQGEEYSDMNFLKSMPNMRSISNQILFVGLISSLFISIPKGYADAALNPILIMELKSGYVETCRPTIVRQLESVGLANAPKARIYCECLSNFYFNDFTNSDYQYLKKSNGLLPERIRETQNQIRVYCADLHLY